MSKTAQQYKKHANWGDVLIGTTKCRSFRKITQNSCRSAQSLPLIQTSKETHRKILWDIPKQKPFKLAVWKRKCICTDGTRTKCDSFSHFLQKINMQEKERKERGKPDSAVLDFCFNFFFLRSCKWMWISSAICGTSLLCRINVDPSNRERFCLHNRKAGLIY